MSSVASADISRLAEALRRTAKESQTTTFEVLVDSSNFLLAEMEARVAVDTGNLRESLGVVVTGNKVIVGPDAIKAPYAKYIEFGTRPHEIKPKSAGGVLRFTAGGKVVYAKKVNHPGTKAQPFVRPAFDAWVDSLGTMAAEANVKKFVEEAS